MESSEEIQYAYSPAEAAKVVSCSMLHMQVYAAQVKFLKQQVERFQSRYSVLRGHPSKLSIDTKRSQLRVRNRTATDFEATLAALFDHQNKISLGAAVRDLVVLMLKARMVRYLSYLFLYVLYFCYRMYVIYLL